MKIRPTQGHGNCPKCNADVLFIADNAKAYCRAIGCGWSEPGALVERDDDWQLAQAVRDAFLAENAAIQEMMAKPVVITARQAKKREWVRPHFSFLVHQHVLSPILTVIFALFAVMDARDGDYWLALYHTLLLLWVVTGRDRERTRHENDLEYTKQMSARWARQEEEDLERAWYQKDEEKWP